MRASAYLMRVSAMRVSATRALAFLRGACTNGST